MARVVTIDVVGRFIDNITNPAKGAAAAVEDVGDAAENTGKDVDALGKKKAKPTFDADNSRLKRKMDEADSRVKKLGQSRASVVINAMDKATSVLNKIEGTAKSLTRKTWSAVVKVKDLATAPLRKLKESLFSIKTLIGTIATGYALNQIVAQPVGLADTIEGAKIAFETKLGSKQKAEEFLQSIYQFDEKSPFDTTQIVGIAQQMMNLGWTAENVLNDLGTIGDWSASLGKGEEGISSVTRALGQMRMKGKLSSEEMLQLTEAGVDAWNYVAKYLGKDITEVREMAEDGAISVDTAIKGIMSGMAEYTGAAATMSDRTVSGLKDQILSLFKTYAVLPWGEGLSEGFKGALTKVRDLIDKNKDSLKGFGEVLKEVGRDISGWFSDRIQNALSRFKDITASEEFKNADGFGKVKLLWNGLIANPFSDWWSNTVIPWWEGTAMPWLTEKASGIGESIGRGLTDGLLMLLGIDVSDAMEDGATIGGSFVQGFLDGFDGGAVTEAFVQAISNVWDAIPTWAKWLLGGYGAIKVGSGITSFISGAAKVLGSAGSMTGLLGFGTKSAIAMGAGNLAGGASLGAGSLSALGLASTAGLAGGAFTLGSGIYDVYQGYKNDDETAKKSGGWKILGAGGGAAAGAAIGSIIPGVGTLVGAGVGALAGSAVGWWQSHKAKKAAAEAAAEEAGELEKLAQSEGAAAEEAAKLMEANRKLKKESLAEHFGDVALSAEEMQKAIRNVVGEKYYTETESIAESLSSMNSSFDAFDNQNSTMKKSLWLASIKQDAKLTEDEIASLKETWDSFKSSGQTAITDAQYAATESITAILGDNAISSALIGKTNRYYSDQMEEYNKLASEYKTKLEQALSDSVITVDEKKSLDEIRGSMDKIIQQLRQDEYEANINILKAKYAGDLTPEGFGDLMSGAAAENETLADSYWEAFGQASVGKTDKEIETLRKGVLDKLSNLWSNTGDLGLGTLREQYNTELGILGKDIGTLFKENTGTEIIEAMNSLDDKTRQGVAGMLEYMQPTTDEIQKLAKSYEDAGMTIPKSLSSYLDSVEFYEALANGPKAIEEYFDNYPIDIDPTVRSIDLTGDEMTKALDLASAFKVQANVLCEWQYDEFDDEWISPDGRYSFTTEALVTAGWTYNEFNQQWISPDGKYSFHTDSDIDVNYIVDKFNGTKSNFGVQNSYNTSTTVNVGVKYKISGSLTNLGQIKMNYASKQAVLFDQARGSLIQPNGKIDSFATGGLVRGGGKIVRVAEEGSPEMIIPVGSQRRERGRKLWSKAGEMLKVPGFARGGSTDGGADEGFRFTQYSGNTADTGEKRVSVDMGGINVQITVSANDSRDIVAVIKEKASEIAEAVAGELADELGGLFENTPVKGGVA